jgi:LysM repeat protein
LEHCKYFRGKITNLIPDRLIHGSTFFYVYNLDMIEKKIFLILILLSLVLAGCAGATAEEAPAATSTPQLPAYATRTPSPPPVVENPPTLTPLPSPTPTPRTHTVAQGEDFGGIAYLYGIKTAALVAANPDVNPNLMSVGTVLLIPNAAQDEALAASSAATPVPVNVSAPDCWPMQDGGMWCFAVVSNPLDEAVESVSVLMNMAAAEGSAAVSRRTAPLLNVIPAGASLPAGAYFPPPVPQQPGVSAQLAAALPAGTVDERYLPVQLEVEEVEVSGDGSAARVQGSLQLEQDEAVEAVVWVALTAKNAAGQVVGWRRWEGQVTIGGGEVAMFTTEVYAVGGKKITSVDTLAEARP